MLAIIWQLARMHYLQILDNKTDKDVLAWASQTAGVELKGFNDSQLSDGKILIKLAEACDPGFVDWEIVEAGEDEEQCAQNAKYAIALARKLEVFIFCTYEDIVVPNKKMMLIMMAGLYDAYNKSQTKA